jgi:hypothetical protein
MDQELALLQARVGKLEKQVEFLLRINGLDLSPLRSVSNEELLKYYRDAVQLLGLTPSQLPPEAIERWAELFLQLSEYEMVRLQGIVDYNHTWEPFYHLAIKMMTSIRQHKDLGSDIGLQHLYATLEKGRRMVRDVAVIMCKRYPDDLPEKAKILLKDGELELD